MSAGFQKTAGQILLAVSLTLFLGGIASFLSHKVELRFLGNIVVTENARMSWIFINALLVCVGLILIYYSNKAKKTT